MNDDNDENRRAVEHCYRTQKTMVNPIVDWTDEDVWEFLNSNNIPHCCLYDEGFTRLGCIGCPLSGSKHMERDFARWPKYKELYIKAFQKMIDNHPGQIKILDPDADTKFKLEFVDGGGRPRIGATGAVNGMPNINSSETYGQSETQGNESGNNAGLLHQGVVQITGMGGVSGLEQPEPLSEAWAIAAKKKTLKVKRGSTEAEIMMAFHIKASYR